MRAFIIRRLLIAVLTLWLVTVIVFFIIRLIPGDVVEMMVAEHEHLVTTTIEEIREALGLNVPIHIQYGKWLGGLIRGDLGNSLWTGRPVIEEITARFPVSLELGFLAFIVAQLIALPIGIYSAIRQDTVGDYIARSIAIIFIAVPSFWIGTMVIVFPSIWWGWSPSMRYIPLVEDPIGNFKMFIIPAAILGMVLSGTTMRMTRTMMLEVLRQDYIRTAWAKGLRERVVVVRHALKNALIPVVTIIGIQLPLLIGGSVILENIFCLPGLGALMVQIISSRDYTVLSGLNVILATLVLIINLGVDLTYAFLDPRVHFK